MLTESQFIRSQLKQLMAHVEGMKDGQHKMKMLGCLQNAGRCLDRYEKAALSSPPSPGPECADKEGQGVVNPIDAAFGAAPDIEDIETIRQKAWTARDVY